MGKKRAVVEGQSGIYPSSHGKRDVYLAREQSRLPLFRESSMTGLVGDTKNLLFGGGRGGGAHLKREEGARRLKVDPNVGMRRWGEEGDLCFRKRPRGRAIGRALAGIL